MEGKGDDHSQFLTHIPAMSSNAEPTSVRVKNPTQPFIFNVPRFCSSELSLWELAHSTAAFCSFLL